ncbi:asparaginase [Haladaptatus salinisoli]|uniref:asparaginase n=1 Tax=Haladaptatus salinisoli TaxID=2884876 RepID=UPI001D0B9389|nr:asparaginase [Haladaptatus salinisoli]
MNVSVLSTGGTIASTSGEDGAVPTESGDRLVEAAPELDAVDGLEVEQVAQIPSYEMDAETLKTIADSVRDAVGDPAVDAVVVTHGTDTMEETAYYLDATLQPETPVFLTGAQRRPDEVSADGPANLVTAFEAARTFANEEWGGTFVAFDGTIHAARFATKVHTSALDAFDSPGVGPVATVDREGVRILRRPRSETTPLENGSLDPSVYVLRSGAGVDETLGKAAVDRGADGLVVEGTGLGNVTAELGGFVRATVDDGVPVVVTSRCVAGRTAPVYGGTGGGAKLREYGAMFAADLSAQKARLKLTLALSERDDLESIRAPFED